jgi:peptide/nickel transport system permease protein
MKVEGGRKKVANRARRVGLSVLAAVGLLAIAAPIVAPHDPRAQFANCLHAPPMPLHVRDTAGRWHLPFFHSLRLVSRLESKYEEMDERRTPGARVESRAMSPGAGGADRRGVPDAAAAPGAPPRVGPGRWNALDEPICNAWLPLGADSFGRDVASRILYGARVSLGVALVAVFGSLLAGAAVGGLAGYFGGAIDEAVMRLAEFILVLPTVYLVLALRAVMPLVMAPAQIFTLMAGIFTLVGWPWVARGVRGIVAAERQREYVEAARAAGAGHARILFRHLLPATFGHLGVQGTLLVPAFILAEATLSFVGLGFPDPVPTWGTMLQDATNVSTLAQFPWTLAPAVAVFVVVLAVNLIVDGRTAA